MTIARGVAVTAALLIATVTAATDAERYLISIYVLTIDAAPGETVELRGERLDLQLREQASLPSDDSGDAVEIRVGETVLDLRHDQPLFDGRPEPPERVQILSAPQLVVEAEQEVVVRSGAPLHYVERDEDGCLRVEQMPDEWSPGVTLRIVASPRPTDADADRIFLEFESKVVTAGERERLVGVPFDVGRPVIQTREMRSFAELPAGRWKVLSASALHPAEDGDGPAAFLLLLVRVDQR